MDSFSHLTTFERQLFASEGITNYEEVTGMMGYLGYGGTTGMGMIDDYFGAGGQEEY